MFWCRGFQPLRFLSNRRWVRPVSIVVSLLSLSWMAVMAMQPVHIPAFEFDRGYTVLEQESLTGVKGQTFVAPADHISRIDLWVSTVVDKPGDFVHMRFDLKRSAASEEAIVTGGHTFEESVSNWQVRLVFDPTLLAAGDRLYLRAESVLSSPYAHVSYGYYGQDVYPDGELLDLDQVAVSGQDLRFTLYRKPALPKPLAWAEAAIAPAITAAEQSAGGPPPWTVAVLMVAVGGGAVALTAGCGVLVARRLAGARRDVTAAVVLALLALVLAIAAGAEAPVAKLYVLML